MKIHNPLRSKLIKSFVRVSLLSTLLLSCGGDQVKVDVLLSANDTVNPLIDISTRMSAGLSHGVFFTLDELDNVPSSVNDTKSGGQSIKVPSNGASGLDPLVDNFSIPTKSLNQNSLYRITMTADINGTIVYTGTGDCPLKVSLADQNQVKICFGAIPAICPGLTNFTSCPGIN